MSSLRAARLGPWMLLTCGGCYALNPEFNPDEQAGAELGSSEGSEAGTELSGGSESLEGSAEAATETGGELETETETGPASETGPAPGVCGDGVVDPELEDCDDGNEASDDGCLADCTIPLSCLEILEFAPDSASGEYLVDPRELGEPWPARCDMELAGGGWTGFSVEDLLCSDHLVNWITALSPAPSEGIEDCSFYAHYLEQGGALEYYWDVEFPPGFDAFFLREYAVQGIGTPELNFVQLVWEVPALFPNGALSFGSAYELGPITTWLAEGGDGSAFADLEVRTYPALEEPFELVESSDLLRIGFGERGITQEGLVPWYSGQIFVR